MFFFFPKHRSGATFYPKGNILRKVSWHKSFPPSHIFCTLENDSELKKTIEEDDHHSHVIKRPFLIRDNLNEIENFGVKPTKVAKTSKPWPTLRSALLPASFCVCVLISISVHGKNGFVTATKPGTTNKFFVAATKNFAAAPKRFVDRTKHFVVVTTILLSLF